MNFEIEYIEKLTDLIKEKELTEITLEKDGATICIRKEQEIVATQALPVTTPSSIVAPMPVSIAPLPSLSSDPFEIKESTKGRPITAPMVGTFYSASAPGSKPYAEVGQTISAGQVVCIVEAMKLMNEVEAEISGRVIEVCVKDGDPVEFGQTLMIVE